MYLLRGLDVEFHGGDKAEIDLYGTYNGDVVAGEVKASASEFTADQIVRDIQYSGRLGVDRHVLASTEPLPGEVVERTSDLTRAAGMRLIIIERRSAREVD